MTRLSAALLLGLAWAGPAASQPVSCGVAHYGMGLPSESAELIIGEVQAEANAADFNAEGDLGITATVTGNGRTGTFVARGSYTRIGSRLELAFGTTPLGRSGEFREHFGPFPTVTCRIR